MQAMVKRLAWALCALCLLQVAVGAGLAQRSRRQAASLQASAPRPSGSASVSSEEAGAQAGAVASAQASAAPERPARRKPVAPQRATLAPSMGAGDEQDEDYAAEPVRRPSSGGGGGNRRRPKGQRGRDGPRRVQADAAEEAQECDEYDGEANGYAQQMFAGPMRHMSRLMGDMFDRVHGIASGDYELGDGNVAVASSYSSDDGDSRVSSLVRNNGRTRGIVSETRNGRTQTRRIGGGNSEGEEEEEEEE